MAIVTESRAARAILPRSVARLLARPEDRVVLAALAVLILIFAHVTLLESPGATIGTATGVCEQPIRTPLAYLFLAMH